MYHGLIQLYLLLQVPSLALGIFEVQGPHHPVVALLGDEAELPCFLMPSQSAQHMKISWFRSLPSQVVHLHSDGKDHPEAAMEQYAGRTELVTDAIHKGIAVLKIFHIQPADSGLYHCRFQDGDYYKDTVVMLYIADMGSAPHFHVQISKPGEMRLECTSEGWFPLPKIQWTNSWGQEIPSVSETQTQDRNGLFQVTATLLLREPAEVNMTCSVWNTVLNQRKEEKLCIAVNESSSHWFSIKTALVTSSILGIPTFIGFCFYKRKLREAKETQTQTPNGNHICPSEVSVLQDQPKMCDDNPDVLESSSCLNSSCHLNMKSKHLQSSYLLSKAKSLLCFAVMTHPGRCCCCSPAHLEKVQGSPDRHLEGALPSHPDHLKVDSPV